MDSIADFTYEENEAFKELKNRIVTNYGEKEAEDFRIYRFLKARDFSVRQAEDMLIKHLHWRKEHKIDTIITDYKMSEIEEKYCKLNLIGYDREGSPIVYTKMGALDFKGLLKSQKLSQYLKYLRYFLTSIEKSFKKQSQKVGKSIETWTIIVDSEGLTILQAIHKPAVYSMFEAFRMYEANYPERLKRAYVINVSAPFYFGYNIVKPIISSETLRKMSFFGKDGWKEELLKAVDPDVLPAFLGGNRTDPDGNELCITTINHGGIVPEHYYFRSLERRLCGQPGVETYNLNRKTKTDITFNVFEPGSIIEWEFESENNDVAFGLFFKDNLDDSINPISLIETQRVDAHQQIESGTFKCLKAGKYILTLDNTHSWFRQKIIYCRSSVVLPSTEKV